MAGGGSSATRIAAGAAAGFGLAWAVLTWLTWLGVYGVPESVTQVELYWHWAGEIVRFGRVPYVDFGIEYPPFGIVTFVLPLVLVGSEASHEAFRPVFQAEMLVLGLVMAFATVKAAAGLGGNRRDLVVTAAFVAATPLLLGPTILSRFDLLPVALTALALWALSTERHLVAATFLGLGVVAKLFPIFLAPAILFWLWRRDGLRGAIQWGAMLALVLVAGFGPFVLLDAHETTELLLMRTLERPLQVEAFGAVLLYLANELAGLPITLVHTFDSWNLEGELPDLLSAAQTLLTVPLLAGIYVAAGHRPAADDPSDGRHRLALAMAAALAVYVALGKAFSPQYVLWLVPPVAILAAFGRRAPLAILAVVLLLTSLYYPRFYFEFFHERQLGWALVVLARNVVLCGLAAVLVLALAGIERRRGGSATESPASSAVSPAAAGSG